MMAGLGYDMALKITAVIVTTALVGAAAVALLLYFRVPGSGAVYAAAAVAVLAGLVVMALWRGSK